MFDGLPSSARPQHPSRLDLDDADPINRGLVGWWPLDEAGGTLADDISPWRGRGTLTNGPTRIVGARGRAVNFDGSNDYIAAAGRQDISAFSASAWLYLSSGATFAHSILSSLFGLDQTILWTVDTFGTVFKFWATTNATNATSATIPHIRERWVCAGVSWAPGRTTRFYLDGIPIGTGTTAGDLRSPVTGWNIGRYGFPNLWYFPGAMRGVRAWRRVLTDREFGRLYADPHAGAVAPEERIFQAYRRAAPLSASIAAGTLSLTASATAEWDSGVPHGVLRRRGRARQWDNVPVELEPVVSLAENFAGAAEVQRAVDDALLRFARIGARTSVARRHTLIDEMRRAVVAAVERAAEDDDEEALTALL